MSTSGITPLTFTGVSTYSSDLQQVLSRAVSIAELPLQQLQNQDSTILSQKSALAGFNQPLSDLASSITALGKLGANKALGASSSDDTIVTATATGATVAGSHTITSITSLATSATSTLTNPVGDTNKTAVSTGSDGAMALVVGTHTYNFTLKTNTLQGLRDAINGLSGTNVSASILTTSGGNYLSLTANSTGAGEIKLKDDVNGANTNIVTTNSRGTNAQFTLDGIPITEPTNNINDVIPGMTFTLENTTSGAQSVTISTSPDKTQLSSALQDFVGKYNAVQSLVRAQMGQNAGPLSGNFIVRQIRSDLTSLSGYQGTASVKSLAAMGVTFNDTGQMSFDQSTLNHLSDSQINDAFTFFGSSTTGFGALAANFTQLSDPISGVIKIQDSSYTQTDLRLQDQMNTLADRINTMQANLQRQLAAADSLLASLQSQQQTLNSSLQAVSLVLYGKQNGTGN